jgi:hypothetical protein
MPRSERALFFRKLNRLIPSQCFSASLFSQLRLPVLISRTARDLEDCVVSLLASPTKRQSVSRAIADAVAAARGPPSSGSGDLRNGGFPGEAGAVLNAALRLGHEAAVLGSARIVIADGA